jgi:hypothetical protein
MAVAGAIGSSVGPNGTVDHLTDNGAPDDSDGRGSAQDGGVKNRPSDASTKKDAAKPDTGSVGETPADPDAVLACTDIKAPLIPPRSALSLAFLDANGSPNIPYIGGDPTGTWQVEASRLFVSESMRNQIDESSRGEVSGWMKFDGNVVHMSISGLFNLVLTSGQYPVPLKLGGGAKFQRQGGNLGLEWPCGGSVVGPLTDTMSFSILGNYGIFVYKRLTPYGEVLYALAMSRL